GCDPVDYQRVALWHRHDPHAIQGAIQGARCLQARTHPAYRVACRSAWLCGRAAARLGLRMEILDGSRTDCGRRITGPGRWLLAATRPRPCRPVVSDVGHIDHFACWRTYRTFLLRPDRTQTHGRSRNDPNGRKRWLKGI